MGSHKTTVSTIVHFLPQVSHSEHLFRFFLNSIFVPIFFFFCTDKEEFHLVCRAMKWGWLNPSGIFFRFCKVALLGEPILLYDLCTRFVVSCQSNLNFSKLVFYWTGLHDIYFWGIEKRYGTF